MWYGIQIAAYAGLLLGHGVVLIVAIRHRIATGRPQRLLETLLLLTILWVVGLGLAALLVTDGWWLFAWQRAAQGGLVVLALLTAEFAAAFAGDRSRSWLRVAFLGLLLAGAFALDAFSLQLAGPLRWLHLGLDGPRLGTWLLGFAWFAATSMAWWSAIFALRRARNSEHRNRIRYLLVALLFFSLGDALILTDGLPCFYIGLLARLLAFVMITFAMVRYDLPDIRHSLLTALRLVLLTTVTFFVYLAALLLGGYISGAFIAGVRLFIFGPVLVALLVAALVDALLGPRLHRWFDRLFLGRNYDIQRALRSYSQQVSLILDLEQLASTTLEWLAATFQVQRSAFILFNALANGAVDLQVLSATFAPLPPNQKFQTDSRFVAHFRNIRRPLSQYDLDMLIWFQVMPAGERQWLQDLGLEIYVPILVADWPVALLALGPRAKGQSYSERDLETLVILAAQTGTALENARLLADLHRLGTELAETNRQLQRLDQTKVDFVTIASHELRTPLAQIYGYSDVLSSLTDDEQIESQEIHGFIEGIAKGAARLKQVVDAMVDISLIETGGLVLHKMRVPVDAVVQRAIEDIRPAADEREMSLVVRDLSTLPYVQADVDRLVQVFVGLLTNAIKYSPNGSEIVVSGRVDALSDGSWVEVLVADSGIGIDPEQQAVIFEKFYRPEGAILHSSDQVGFKGAGPGLGLAIARGIVAAHQGSIWVESSGRDEKGCPGSTFHVRLPAAGLSQEGRYA